MDQDNEKKFEEEDSSFEERLVLRSADSLSTLRTQRIDLRPRSNTISVLQSVQVTALRTRIKELESEIRAQRKRFWKTQDKNSQTHIQVKRRVSIDFAGAITAGKKEIARLNDKIKELQLNLDTAKEASVKELERVKAKFDLERAGFLERLHSLEKDVSKQKLTSRNLESKLADERGKNEELSCSLTEQKSLYQELQCDTERMTRTQEMLLSHVKALNLNQCVVRVTETASLKRCQFRVATDWNIEYLQNILRVVYLPAESRNKFELELYQGDPNTASPLKSLKSLISASTRYEETNQELIKEVNCKPERLLLPIADLSLKLIPHPKPEILAPTIPAITPEATTENEVPHTNVQGCCIIS